MSNTVYEICMSLFLIYKRDMIFAPLFKKPQVKSNKPNGWKCK